MFKKKIENFPQLETLCMVNTRSFVILIFFSLHYYTGAADEDKGFNAALSQYSALHFKAKQKKRRDESVRGALTYSLLSMSKVD